MCADDLEKFQQDDIIKEALSKGVDLRNYSRQIDLEMKAMEVCPLIDVDISIGGALGGHRSLTVHRLQGLCIRDYLREADNLASLHGQVFTVKK